MAYASLSDAKTRIAADGGTVVGDAIVAALLDKAKADIDAYCRHDFDEHKDSVVMVEGRGTDKYLLPVFPVLALSSIELDGEALSEDQLSAVKWYPWGVLLFPFKIGRGVLITIKLDYGYESPPANVIEATLRLVSRYARLPQVIERIALGMTNEKIADYTASFVKQEIDKDIGALLAKDRKIK